MQAAATGGEFGGTAGTHAQPAGGAASAEVERALAQALLDQRERAAFRAEATQALSGLLNPARTVTRTLQLLVPRLAVWGQLAVGRAAGFDVTSSRGSVARVYPAPPTSDRHRTMRRVWRTGQVGAWTVAGADELVPLVPDDRLRAEVPGGPPYTALVLPLRAAGETFGSLVLLRRGVDSFDERVTAMCADVAEVAAGALHAGHLYAARVHTSRVLQDSLLPRALPAIPGVRMASFYRSTSAEDEVGGDFYDVHGGDGEWSVVLGDVSGSGIEAAVLTGQARQALRTAGLVDRSPARMLDLANRSLLQSAGSRFVTILCCRLVVEDRGGLRLDVASAGHPPPLVLRGDGMIEEPRLRGMAAGLFAEGDHTLATLHLAPGDRCLLYTDGATEARSPDGTFFGDDRLRAALAACRRFDPDAIVGYVSQQVLEHVHGGRHDDIALLALGGCR